MSLKGVICSDDGQQYGFADCIACARSGGPRTCHNPLPMLIAMSKNQEDRKDAGLSATMVLDCPRRVILSQEEDFYERPEDCAARFYGTIGHAGFEMYGGDFPGVIQEQRFRRSINVDGVEVEITGKSDWVDVERKLIIDYKFVSSISSKPISLGLPKDSHTEQVNLYRWLVAGGVNMVTGKVENHEIEKGGILYVSTGGKVRGSRKVAVDIWTLEETEEFLRERLRPLVAYQQTKELPPVLTDEKGRRHYFCIRCALREACDAREELRNLE